MRSDRRRAQQYFALCTLYFVLVLVLVLACTAGPAREAQLRSVVLPDLYRMSRPVQDQLREADAALERKRNDPVMPRGDLGSAYGALGNLLMAAEYLDAAEACYL